MAMSARDFMPKQAKAKKVAKPKPVSSGVNKRAASKAAAEAKLAGMPKPGSRRGGMGNKEFAMTQKPKGPKGRALPKKKTTRKFVVDPRYKAGF